MADGLLNKASIILTPTGYKAGTLYNVAPIDEPYEDFDFARASTATRINSSGLVSNIATGVPRISYDSNGDNGHILLEPTSTNLITYSENFDETTSDWTNTNISVETNSTISPQGINNAAKITEDTSNSEHQIQFVFSQTINTNYSYSVFVKANGRNYCGMNIGASRLYANFDLTDGSVTNVQSNGTDFNNESASITSFGNGWYKCTLSGYALTINGSYVRFTLRNVESSNSFLNYLGDGTSGAYIWGAQLEALSYATSYIPTLTGSTETRATETATGAGSAELINSTEGVLYAEIAAFDDGLTKRISLNNGTTSSRVIFQYNPTLSIIKYFYVNTTNQCVLEHTLTDITNFSKIALKWKQNDFALWVDGVERDSDNSGNVLSANTLTTLDFDGTTDSYPFYGKCKALAVFNEALSDSELTQLTT